MGGGEGNRGTRCVHLAVRLMGDKGKTRTTHRALGQTPPVEQAPRAQFGKSAPRPQGTMEQRCRHHLGKKLNSSVCILQGSWSPILPLALRKLCPRVPTRGAG